MSGYAREGGNTYSSHVISDYISLSSWAFLEVFSKDKNLSLGRLGVSITICCVGTCVFCKDKNLFLLLLLLLYLEWVGDGRRDLFAPVPQELEERWMERSNITLF